jgi:hypothetical protein
VGRDAGGVVRNHTNKKILPSSGERLIRRAKRRIVLDVFLARGPTWKHIREMRERWGIEAQPQVPPPYQGAEYTPQALQSRPEEEFGEEAERWSATFDEWRDDLAVLYEAVVPAEARDSDYHMSFGWSVFLSMCVLFDPPETQLVEFVERFGWAGSNVVPRGDRTMNAPPIVWRKEHNELEATWMEFYEGLLEALLEKYVHPQGVTTEEAMRGIREENPEIFERWRDRLHGNESRPFIDVQPYHRREDIESAFQVLYDRHGTRPALGREKRDELTAVQCAILHDRHNIADPTDRRRRRWAFERLAEHFDGLESARAAKDHVALGRSLLNQYRGR